MRNRSCLYRKNLRDEYCLITAHERKYVQKLLSGQRGNNGAQKEKRCGRKKVYGEEEEAIIKEIWLKAEQPYGYPHGSAEKSSVKRQDIKSLEKRYVNISEALAPLKLITFSKSIKSTLAKAHGGEGEAPMPSRKTIEVRVETWNVEEAGWLEIDTVAHCGGKMRGSFYGP